MIVVDQAWDRATPDQLREYGAGAVCRYLGEDRTGKNLTKAEADAYIAAGIAIVSNYEFQPGSALKGYAEGRRVARLADAQHRACGGPADRPIYFSVDVDITSATQMAAVREWARGINDEIGLARTGVYGEYEVIKALFDAGRIRWGWQTYAWSYGAWEPRAQLRQVRNGIPVGGHDVDRNESQVADFGQWGHQGDDMPLTNDDIKRFWEYLVPNPGAGGQLTFMKDFSIFGNNVAWANSAKLDALAAADETRDKATLAAIQALAAGGASVDTSAVVNAVNAVRDEARAQFAALHDQLAAKDVAIANLQAKLAAAAKAEADTLATS